ncbi:hypothetical protein AwDysgo_02040 [Bacteroidales bacterium]|nr:hypothetical protein AwDysgo_02040 [Bacteroidales bacterium]
MEFKKIFLISLLFSFLSFFSCIENEVYVDLAGYEMPYFQVEEVNVEKEISSIYFNTDVHEDTVFVHFRYLRYELKIPDGLKCRVEVYFNDDVRDYSAFTSYINIPLDSGTHTMRVELIMSFDSSKSQDINWGQEEVYREIHEWVVVVQPRSTVLNVRTSRTYEGEVVFFWDKPDPYYGELDYFLVSSLGSRTPVRTENQFFTLKDFSNREQQYVVTARFKEGFLKDWEELVGLKQKHTGLPSGLLQAQPVNGAMVDSLVSRREQDARSKYEREGSDNKIQFNSKGVSVFRIYPKNRN